MTNTSREAFEAWWEIHHEDATNYKDAFDAGWQAANSDKQAQVVEPVAAVFNGHYQQRAELEDGIVHNLYLHPAPPPAGDRAELITNLRELIDLHAWAKVVTGMAANMLEAAVRWKQVARVQDAKLRAMVGNPGGIEKLREVLGKVQAQAGAVPETPEQHNYRLACEAVWEDDHAPPAVKGLCNRGNLCPWSDEGSDGRSTCRRCGAKSQGSGQ